MLLREHKLFEVMEENSLSRMMGRKMDTIHHVL